MKLAILAAAVIVAAGLFSVAAAIDRAAAVYFTDGAELAPPDISWKDEA